jgi:uncharacterized protein YecT (DUF1311 family)
MRTAVTQMAMNSCASAKLARVDKRLNQTYRKLLAESVGHRDVTVKVRKMERIWMTYRDRYMAAMYPAKDKQAEYGSIFPMEADLVLAQITGNHIGELQLLVNQYNPLKHGLNIP